MDGGRGAGYASKPVRPPVYSHRGCSGGGAVSDGNPDGQRGQRLRCGSAVQLLHLLCDAGKLQPFPCTGLHDVRGTAFPVCPLYGYAGQPPRPVPAVRLCAQIQLIIALVIGLLVSVFQAATQIQEQTLTFVPKLIAIATILIVGGSWMLNKLVVFTNEIMNIIANVKG